jgi:2-oxo-4-hydroxy-4-carboxy-5-ureidoimidazoline decarboxylase
MKLVEFNKQARSKAKEDLFRCCGCSAWVEKLITHFPFSSIEDLKLSSDKIWFSCTEEDWKEAFSHHPKIGERSSSKNNNSKEWSQQEQSGVEQSEKTILEQLQEVNKTYENKFGFIFIVYATGKTASEMFDLLRKRLTNDYEKEIHIASGEQNKITHLRIDKLLS